MGSRLETALMILIFQGARFMPRLPNNLNGANRSAFMQDLDHKKNYFFVKYLIYGRQILVTTNPSL